MVSSFGGQWNKSIWPMFKTKMLIYQPKSNLDENFFGKNHLLSFRPEIRKTLLQDLYWESNSCPTPVRLLPVICIFYCGSELNMGFSFTNIFIFSNFYRVTQKKLHELDHSWLLEIRNYCQALYVTV